MARKRESKELDTKKYLINLNRKLAINNFAVCFNNNLISHEMLLFIDISYDYYSFQFAEKGTNKKHLIFRLKEYKGTKKRRKHRKSGGFEIEATSFQLGTKKLGYPFKTNVGHVDLFSINQSYICDVRDSVSVLNNETENPIYSWNRITYTPSPEIILDTYMNNATFRSLISSGMYVYADKAFCINLADTVKVGEDGLIHLTQYAKKNASKCMIAFNIQRQVGVVKSLVSVSHGSLGQEVVDTADIKYPMSMNSKTGSTTTVDNVLMFQSVGRYNSTDSALSGYRTWVSAPESVSSVFTPLPFNFLVNEVAKTREEMHGMGFGDAVKYHMKKRKMTIAKLHEITGIDTRRINRIRSGELNGNLPIEDVIAIIVALKIPPPIGKDLLELNKIHLNKTREDSVYEIIISSMYLNTIEEVNHFLSSVNMPSIPKRKSKENLE